MTIPNTFLPGFRLIDGSQLNSNFAALGAADGPQSGVTYYVNATAGADAGNGGQDPLNPLATIDAALVLEKAALAQVGLGSVGRNSIVAIWGTLHRTATLSWNLPGTHLVGLCAPGGSERARISSTGTVPFSPLVSVPSGSSGCMFVDIQAFHGGQTGGTGSQVCWDEEGGRNFYSNVQFLGGGDATIAILAGCRSLTVGSDDNKFYDCIIGLDTIQRGTAVNAELEFIAGTSALPARNTFRQCIFNMWSSLTTNLHVLVTVMDRYTYFDHCFFNNNINSGGGSLLAVGFTVTGTAGQVIIDRCASVGATKFATSGNIYQIDATTGLGTKIT